MLLVINGEAGHGKDYVADWCAREFNLVKIAFADPMKRFCRHLFGFETENLWGPSEKRNEMLDAKPLWSCAYSQLHVIHQFIAAMVPEHHGFDMRALAFSTFQGWFTELRNKYSDKLSARITLQTLGTECGRAINPNIWTDYLYDVERPLIAKGYQYTQELGIRLNEGVGTPKKGIVIPDLRFINELKASEERGCYSLRTRRLALMSNTANVGLKGHQSEQEQKGIPDSRINKVLEFPEGLDRVDEMLKAWRSELGTSAELSR